MKDDSETTPLPTLAPDSFEVHIAPQTVQLGQPFSLYVSLKHAPSFRFELLNPPNNSSFDIFSKTRSREDGPQDSTTTFSLQMAAFELGTLELPPLQFEVATPEQVGSFVLPSQTLAVASSLKTIPSQLEDVRPPAPLFIASYTLLYWGAAVLAVTLASVLIWKWWSQRKKVPLPVVPKSLEERTREALNALQAQALPAQGKTREYYFMLSEIIRGYIGELHHFDALECTTTEFVASIQNLHSTELPIDALAKFSYESDFIKYAKGNADIAKCELDFKFACHLVEKTSPTDPPPIHHVQPPLP
ncbi:MAG: BatD family protein [Cystobacterineae bacterium]|nr:BatD family protein [Cystobacterineae bacterium]